MANGFVIRSCSCRSDYQDRAYGKGLRVHTKGSVKTRATAYVPRCTVCGTPKSEGGGGA